MEFVRDNMPAAYEVYVDMPTEVLPRVLCPFGSGVLEVKLTMVW